MLNTCYHLFPKNFKCFPNKSSSKNEHPGFTFDSTHDLLVALWREHRSTENFPLTVHVQTWMVFFTWFHTYPPGNPHPSHGLTDDLNDFLFPVWWDMWSFPGGYTFSKIWGEKCQFTQFTTTILHMIFLKWVSTPPPTMTIVRIVV